MRILLRKENIKHRRIIIDVDVNVGIGVGVDVGVRLGKR
jgi:hypothetical protein